MTIAAEHEQPISAGAERPFPGAAPGSLILLPGVAGADVGACSDGACRLPATKD